MALRLSSQGRCPGSGVASTALHAPWPFNSLTSLPNSVLLTGIVHQHVVADACEIRHIFTRIDDDSNQVQDMFHIKTLQLQVHFFTQLRSSSSNCVVSTSTPPQESKDCEIEQ